MDNLIKRLQDEAGLTQEQAIKALGIIKDFMDKEGLDIDWKKFFKSKYQEISDKAKDLFENVSDKAEDLASKAKDTAKDITDKASHLFKDDK